MIWYKQNQIRIWALVVPVKMIKWSLIQFFGAGVVTVVMEVGQQ